MLNYNHNEPMDISNCSGTYLVSFSLELPSLPLLSGYDDKFGLFSISLIYLFIYPTFNKTSGVLSISNP
jgi:hypothetical protein